MKTWAIQHLYEVAVKEGDIKRMIYLQRIADKHRIKLEKNSNE